VFSVDECTTLSTTFRVNFQSFPVLVRHHYEAQLDSFFPWVGRVVSRSEECFCAASGEVWDTRMRSRAMQPVRSRRAALLEPG